MDNEPLLEMFKLTVEEINATGGVDGQQVEIIVIDNGSTSLGSALAAQKAIELDVVAVIGALWSSHSLSMAPILQKAGVPMITPTSTNPEITMVGDYIFRACFIDSFQGMAMAQFAKRDLGANSAIIISNIDEKYSIELADYFKEEFVRSSGKIVAEYGYRGNATDFTEIIEKIRIIKPDVLYLPGYSRDSGLFIKQSRKLGIATTFLGGDAWDMIGTYAGSYLNGSYHTAAWHPDVPFQESNDLRRILREKHKEEILSSISPLVYDSVMLLKEAMTRCHCTDRKKVRDSLASIKNYEGATGKFAFDLDGNPEQKGIIIVQFQQNIPTFRKVVQP